MDDEAIVIQIEIRNVAKAMADIKRVAKQVGTMDAGVGKQARQVGQLNSQYQRLASTAQKVQRLQSGPAARLQAAQMNYSQAMKFGTGTQVFDAQVRLQQAQQAHAKAQRAIGGNGAALKSTQMLASFSQLAEELGPVGTQAAAAAVGLGLAAKAAIDAGTKLMKLGLTSGGNAQETSRLSVLGNALGIDMGAAAREFADTIAHDGVAAGFAARAGIHDYGIFDTTDKAGKLLEWVKYLRTLSDPEALRQARATHREDLLPLRQLSDYKLQQLQGDAASKQKIVDPEFARQSLEFQTAMARFGDTLTTLGVAVIKPIMPMLIGDLNWFANTFKHLAEEIDKIKNWNGLRGMFGIPPARNAERQTDAMDRHTAAMEDHALALRNGIFGGGERARGALPPKWGGMNTSQWTSEAVKLGAFAL